MYSIHKFIDENFGSYTKPSFGALKPALVRLEKDGYINTRKIMSDGGRPAVYYSITKNGLEFLKKLLLQDLSENPLQFLSNARVKLSCASFLAKDECSQMFFNIKSLALKFKIQAEDIINDEYNQLSFYQRIVLDNAICEYANFISMIEGLEKDNAGNR